MDDCKKHRKNRHKEEIKVKEIQTKAEEKKEVSSNRKEAIFSIEMVPKDNSLESKRKSIIPLLIERKEPVKPFKQAEIIVKEPVVMKSTAMNFASMKSTATKQKIVPSKPSFPGKDNTKPPSKRQQKLDNELKSNKRLDSWMNPGMHKDGSELSERKKAKFDMEEHLERFDPSIHGRFWTKNGYIYKFPDGRVVSVSSDVTELTEDGELRSA